MSDMVNTTAASMSVDGKTSQSSNSSSKGSNSPPSAPNNGLTGLSLPELYQRRLAMLRELHTLEDAIKNLETQQADITANASGSLAAAIDGRIKALNAEVVEAAIRASKPEDGPEAEGPSLDELFKETIKKNATLLIHAYDTQRRQGSTSVFVPPVAVIEATQRSSVSFILNLIKKGTHTVSGLKECNKIAEIACSPIGFSKEEVPRLGESHESAIRYFTLLARLHFRQLFIAETILHARHLINDAKGNAFMQRAIPLMTVGSNAPGAGYWYATVLGGDKQADLAELGTEKALGLWDAEAQLGHVTGKGTASELLLLIASLGATLADSACHTNGTRAILKIAESMESVRECVAFLTCVEGGDGQAAAHATDTALAVPTLTSRFINLLIDMNGNSILNKVLSSNLFSGEGTVLVASQQASLEALRKQVYGIMTGMCLDVCRNRQGCCTIQRCIVSAPEPFKQAMVDVVLANALKLVQDPFGNYVIQFLLDSGVAGPDSAKGKSPSAKKQPSKYTNLIIRQLLHHIPALSTNKFSSNVIEKCLKNASADVKQLLIDELTDPQALAKLLVDSYANYVIQTAIESAGDELQFKQIRDAITPLQHLLKNSPYGGKIESRLERRQKDIQSQKRSFTQGNGQHQQQAQGQGREGWSRGGGGAHQRNGSNASGGALGNSQNQGQYRSSGNQRNRGAEDAAASPTQSAQPVHYQQQQPPVQLYQQPYMQPYQQQVSAYGQSPQQQTPKGYQQPAVAVSHLQQPFVPAPQSQPPYAMQPPQQQHFQQPPPHFNMPYPQQYVGMPPSQAPQGTYLPTQPYLQMPAATGRPDAASIPYTDPTGRAAYFLNSADGSQQPQQQPRYFYSQ